ncbi:MAG: GNAT family N-acetyltransferase [Pseudomonadota bacterium]|nr:GNAT family N-acetyltransferase [Pseudomonadota bacterium]
MSLPTRSAATWIETDRLLLRAYEPAHFGPFFELMADPETFRFSERGAMTSDEAWGRLLRHIGQWSVTGYGLFAVEEKASGRFVGEAGLADFRRQLGARFDAAPEASWTIAPAAQGRGYATEAAGAALKWMEDRFGSMRAVCLVHLQNGPSLRVAEKLGFRPIVECRYKGYPARLHQRVAGE